MPVLVQIGFGSMMILFCAAIQIASAAYAITHLRKSRPFENGVTARRATIAIGAIFLLFLLGHTLHVYLWAAAFWATGALHGYEEPIYFALVSYSTLGYGDVTLGSDFRIFGAMASICGVLMFGLTTAFLVGVFARLLNARPE